MGLFTPFTSSGGSLPGEGISTMPMAFSLLLLNSKPDDSPDICLAEPVKDMDRLPKLLLLSLERLLCDVSISLFFCCISPLKLLFISAAAVLLSLKFVCCSLCEVCLLALATVDDVEDVVAVEDPPLSTITGTMVTVLPVEDEGLVGVGDGEEKELELAEPGKDPFLGHRLE